MRMTNMYSFCRLLPLFSSLIILFIIGYVAGQRKRGGVNRAFILLFLDLFALTLLEYFLRQNVGHRNLLNVTLRAIAFFATFNGFLFLNVVYAMSSKKHDISFYLWGVVASCYGIAMLFFGASIADPFPGSGNAGYVPSKLFLLLFFTCITFPEVQAFFIAIKYCLTTTDHRRKREFFFLLVGTVTAGAFYAFFVILLPVAFHVFFPAQFTSVSFVVFALVLFRAVTKHKFMSIDVDQIQQVSHQLFSNMRDAVVLLNSNGDAIQANKAAFDLFMITPGKIDETRKYAASVFSWSLLLNKIPGYKFDETYSDASLTLSTEQGERTILLSQSMVKESDNSLGRLLVVRDITGERKMEQELAKSRQIESLGILAGGLAHDFNNLLTGIMAAFSLIKRNTSADRDLLETADHGLQASVQAAKLTKQLLTFAKGGEPVKETVDVRPLITETVEFALHGSGCTCAFFLSDDVDRIVADKGQISQVFQNLTINAVQAMQNGGTITIHGKRRYIGPKDNLPLNEGEYIEIVFSDTGTGIAKPDIDRIFEPYFTTKQNGNGLGLATVYSIIKKHKGHITVTSKPGLETSFFIYLPYVKHAIAPETTQLQQTVSYCGTVLVVDDDPVVLESLEKILQWIGFSTLSAGNGIDAIRVYNEFTNKGNSFAFCILDLTMPGGLNGKDLGVMLRKKDNTLKIIIASGYHDDPVVARFSDHGFSAALTKPFDIDKIKDVIGTVLSA